MAVSFTELNSKAEIICLYLFREILVICYVLFKILKEVVAETLRKRGIAEAHECFAACSQRLFEISKFYLKVPVFSTNGKTEVMFSHSYLT